MPICTRCCKDVDPSLEHSCTPTEVYAFEDLLKRLDKLIRMKIVRSPLPDSELGVALKESRRGALVSFEQVKTVVGQWVADQKEGK